MAKTVKKAPAKKEKLSMAHHELTEIEELVIRGLYYSKHNLSQIVAKMQELFENKTDSFQSAVKIFYTEAFENSKRVYIFRQEDKKSKTGPYGMDEAKSGNIERHAMKYTR